MKVCTYCDCECKDTDSVCPHCGAADFNRKCEKCGAIHKGGSKCPECGYDKNEVREEPAEIRVEHVYINNTDSVNTAPVKKRKTGWWVMGWIFIFPIPMTIIFTRKKDMNLRARIGIIAGSWLLYILIGLLAG